jgi:hypothetical protein
MCGVGDRYWRGTGLERCDLARLTAPNQPSESQPPNQLRLQDNLKHQTLPPEAPVLLVSLYRFHHGRQFREILKYEHLVSIDKSDLLAQIAMQ